ncbi:MAG: SBBP repeat-containing protein [Pyrinomonadaceae bacterium]
MKKLANANFKRVVSILVLFTLIFSILPNTKVLAEKLKNDNLPVKENLPENSSSETFGNIPVYFEQNNGQFDKRVKFFARGTSGYSLFLTATEAVYVLRESPKSEFRNPKLETDDQRELGERQRGAAVFMKLAGANEYSNSVGLEQMTHKTNYFTGEELYWRTEIPNYRRVRMENVYQGVDTIWHGRQNGEVQYDFVVKPNSDPNQIEWEIEGAESAETDSEGNLLIKTEFGTIKQEKPFSFQEDTNGVKQEIESSFKIESPNDGQKYRIKFEVGAYDDSKPLVIDPSVNLSHLAYSTFLGTEITETGDAIDGDYMGNVYVTGKTASLSFPTTPGSLDNSHNGSFDIFVTKLNASGSGIIYSTFIGGNGADEVKDIAVDSSGNAFITGYTPDSPIDYPTTSGAFDTTHNGGLDAFVTRLNASGSALLYSTLIGGSSDDRAFGIAIHPTGNSFFITGYTSSTNYPTFGSTFGPAYDTTYNGGLWDAFVTKFNPGGSAVYSTFLGGSGNDRSFDVDWDPAGNAYVTGDTTSSNFPTTSGVFDTTINGSLDVFVTKLNNAGSGLIYSTYIGAGFGSGIAVHNTGVAYITGTTGTDLFPTTPGAFDTTFNGNRDAFVTGLNFNGSGLLYSTFIGGSNIDDAFDIKIDQSANAIVTGQTTSTNYPVTSGAFDVSHNGDSDVFVAKLNNTGNTLLYSTYIGGSGSDAGFGIAADFKGNIFVTGQTDGVGTTAFPSTNGTVDSTYNGGLDAFITKLGDPSSPIFDFDGDGRTDFSIFRPSVGQWWYLKSSDGGNNAFTFGNSSDKLVPADYTGDGKTDIAFFRPSAAPGDDNWFVLRSEDSSFYSFPFGVSTDIATAGDFDGDGRADAAVYRPSGGTWFILRSSDNGTTIQNFGIAEDKPVVADYDGDGMDDIAVYRPSVSQWWILRSTAGLIVYQFGVNGDQTMPGDYTGDGKADVAFFRPSAAPGDDNWFVLRSEDSSFYSFPFGVSTDIPTAGDFDGDGRMDAAVFRPSTRTWFVQGSTSGVLIVDFGVPGDIPIPSVFSVQ